MIFKSLILQSLQSKNKREKAPADCSTEASSYPEKLKLLLCFFSKQRCGWSVFHSPLHPPYCSLNHLSKSLVICSPQLGKLGRFLFFFWFHVILFCAFIYNRQQFYSNRCLAPFNSSRITVSRLPFLILPILIPSSQINNRESASCSIARDSLVWFCSLSCVAVTTGQLRCFASCFELPELCATSSSLDLLDLAGDLMIWR